MNRADLVVARNGRLDLNRENPPTYGPSTEGGADALRFTMIYLAPLGQDVLFSVDKCETGRNFANKIWNAGRFLLMNSQNISVNEELVDEHIDFADEWVISHFHLTLVLMNNAMENFEINNATKILYSFVWNDFCSWYLEMIKTRLYSDNENIKSATLTRALNLFEDVLKIVHPFMPFITEELWQLIKQRSVGESISTSSYPVLNNELIKRSAESEMEKVQGIVYAIRNIRGEMNIPPSKKLNVIIKSSAVNEYQIDYIKKLALIDKLNVGDKLEKPNASASAVFGDLEIYVPLEGIIDLDVERKKMAKELNRLDGLLTGLDKKLSKEKLIGNGPKDVVDKEKDKQRDWRSKRSKLNDQLDKLN